MPHKTVETPDALAWAVGNPLSEYQKEYYRKRCLRQKTARPLSQKPSDKKDFEAGEASLHFAMQHDPLLHGTPTTSRLDFPPKQSSSIRARGPAYGPMPERKFTAETVYSNTYTAKPISLVPFDAKGNVNIARNKYDPKGNPWFGKSLNSVDFPDWGHPHQTALVDKSRPLGPSLPFTATTTSRTDFTAPTKRAERYHKAKAELVPSAPLTNATMYREDLEWSGGASKAPPCAVGYLAEAEPSLEKACCQSAGTHSQQLAQDLNSSDRHSSKHRAPIRLEEMGAAGSNSARGPVLTGKRMYAENLQQIAGSPYAAGGIIKPETSYQRFCTAFVH